MNVRVPDNFSFRAGQYIWLMIPELKYPDLRGNTRMFSVSSSSNRRGELAVVFRNSRSGYKRTLAEMTPGAEVLFSGPYGSLGLPINTSRSVAFVAGGIGVAPFLSMIRFATESGSNQKITLIYANAIEDDAAYLDELARMEKENSNFKLIAVFGHFNKNFLKDLISQKPLWYIVGPPKFSDYVGKFLIKKNVKLKDMFFEENYPDLPIKKQ